MVENPTPGHEGYTGRLAIPYITPTGVTTIRFRCMQNHKCNDHGHAKYYGLPGHKPRIYNTPALLRETDVLYIIEGEFDTMTAEMAGLDAVGYQGTGAWESLKDDYGETMNIFGRAIGHYETIIIPADGDPAGLAEAKEIAQQLKGYVKPWPDGEDANSIAQKEGLSAVRKALEV